MDRRTLTLMATLKWSAGNHWLRAVLVALAATALAACMTNVDYSRPGASFEQREGKTLVFSRIRFFYDGREIYPWDASAFYDAVLEIERAEARHIWLRRLDVTEMSWELRPDTDGALTLWLLPGDYAMFGTEDDPGGPGEPALAVVALLRVPAGQPVVYAGELTFTEDLRQGGHPYYIFGSGTVTTDSLAAATRKLESRYGTLRGPPTVSAWCVGKDLPSGNYSSELRRQLQQLLDQGCSASH
jgi:hypothetical protein